MAFQYGITVNHLQHFRRMVGRGWRRSKKELKSSFSTRLFWTIPVCKLTWQNGNSPCPIGNTSSNGGFDFPFAMLVYRRVDSLQVLRKETKESRWTLTWLDENASVLRTFKGCVKRSCTIEYEEPRNVLSWNSQSVTTAGKIGGTLPYHQVSQSQWRKKPWWVGWFANLN